MNIIRQLFGKLCAIRFGSDRNLMAADPILYGQMMEVFAIGFAQGAVACSQVYRTGNHALPGRFEAQMKKDLADISKSLSDIAERMKA